MIPVEPEEARETADEILSRPEFQEAQPTLIERTIDWVFEQLNDLFGVVFGSGGGYWFGYLVIALALVVAGYFVWRFFPRRRLARPVHHRSVHHETISRRSRAEWLAAAGDAERAGRWDDAVHARYHALTTGLADEEVLPAEPSTTSGEHRRAYAAGGQPAHVEAFGQATDRYEEVWFGGSPAARPDSDQLVDVDRELLGDDR